MFSPDRGPWPDMNWKGWWGDNPPYHVPTFILTPLTYLGGVFYSVKLLPAWAETATHLNPIFYMVNAFRYGLLGVSDVPLWVAYALMLGFAVVLGTLALWLLKRGVGLRS